MAICWLIEDPGREKCPPALEQFARLRGLEVRRAELAEATWQQLEERGDGLIAISFGSFAALLPAQRERLKLVLNAGANLYLAGSLLAGDVIELSPLANVTVRTGPARPLKSYKFRNHALLPIALAGEQSTANLLVPRADLAGTSIDPMLIACDQPVEKQVALFTIECGQGLVICDLLQPTGKLEDHKPIVHRLADPLARPASIGPLVAVNSVSTSAWKASSGFNLVIDDRPANYDYFNTSHLLKWLMHIDTILPGVHVDFAWTPDQSRPSRRYIRTLQKFNVGFVWHGLKRHVDHRKILSFDDELRDGERLVRTVCKRYGLRFQPVMIFPFERFKSSDLERLATKGFICSVANPDADDSFECRVPSYLRYSTPLHEMYDSYLPVLRRYPVESLTPDLMLAHATLGLPVIAEGHPGDVGLKRFAFLNRTSESLSYFDRSLQFASNKALRPVSLEQMALELIAPRRSAVPNSESLQSAA